MAINQLSLYNNALQLIGERRLPSLDDTVQTETRNELDAIWNFDTFGYCAQQCKPRFATNTILLESTGDTVPHDLNTTHELPDDFICIVDIYSDAELTQPVSRYLYEGNFLYTDYPAVYLRYISNTSVNLFERWTPLFARVVSSFLAKELAERIYPNTYEKLMGIYETRVEEFKQNDTQLPRPKQTTTSLTPVWLRIYNDALMILGQLKITNVNDDSHRRSILDTSVDSELVSTILEDIGWHWAITSRRLNNDPSLEPEWGYRYAFRLPDNLHRFDGVWYDEYMKVPVREYMDEDGILFCSDQEIFIQYVDSRFITDPESWTASFRRFVASKMAYDVCNDVSLNLSNIQKQHVMSVYDKREREIKAIDAQQSPPLILTQGNCLRSRYQDRSDRNRP